MSPLRSGISGGYPMSDSIGSFSELNLSAPLLQALADVGYENPSPIQQACIPPLLEGLDLLGEAQTGTGKTAAFALPLLQRLDLKLLEPQILVLTPTRELAIQVAEAFQKYAKHLPGFHVLPIYGGQSMFMQLKQLRRGVHVIVGTPGQLVYMVRNVVAHNKPNDRHESNSPRLKIRATTTKCMTQKFCTNMSLM